MFRGALLGSLRELPTPQKIARSARGIQVSDYSLAATGNLSRVGVGTRAASIRIRAEMKGAQLYRETEKAKPVEKGGKRAGPGGKVIRSHGTTVLQPKTLQQLGISKTQSSNWKKLASRSGPPIRRWFPSFPVPPGGHRRLP